MPLTDDVMTGLIEAVRDAARREILPRFRNLSADQIDTKSGPDDLVTVADRAAEARLTAAAQKLLPGALVVGEEGVAEDPAILDRFAEAELAVVIDPVDGTWNFANGLANFGVILAVVEDGRTIFGLLYDPVLDDWITATPCGGAWFCRPGAAPRRLSGPPARPRDRWQAFLPLRLYAPEYRAALWQQAQGFGDAFTLRCSCHEYRMMALGHADLMLAPVVKPWDHAAGVLIVEECGGAVWSGGTPGYQPAGPAHPLMVTGRAEAGEDPALWLPAGL